MTEKTYLAVRWAGFINCVWIAVLATIIFLFDGVYPADYLTWMTAIGVCRVIMPWCFIDPSKLL